MLATGTSRRDTAKDMAHAPCALLSRIHSPSSSHVFPRRKITWRSVVSKRIPTSLTRACAAVLFLLLAIAPAAYSQMMSGQITGRLADSGGAVIAGAKIQLTNELTNQVREFQTDSSGNFTFTNVPPGNYTIRVAHPGFKTYEQKAINVGAVEKVALPEITLQVGDVSTSVEVQASAVRVSTDSSDRGVGITTRQI